MVRRLGPDGVLADNFEVEGTPIPKGILHVVLGLRLHLAVLTALCCGLWACSGVTESESPEGGLDGAAAIEGDAATAGESDGPVDQSPGNAESSPPDVSAGRTGADSGTKAAGDAASLSPAAATAYLGNPAHTSSVIDPSLAPPLAPMWSFEPAVGVSISYPLIAGGRVYFVYGGNSSGATPQLVAVGEHTGATIWGPVDLGANYVAGQAYDGEQVFTVDNAGLVRAFDAATGAASWTHPLGGISAAGQPTAYRGLLYVAANGVVTALDEATGQVRWTAPFAGAGQTSPAVTDDGVFVSMGCGDTAAFNRTTGSVLWHHVSQCTGTGAIPLVFDRRVYVNELEPVPAHTDVYDALNGGLIASLPCFIYPAFDNGHAYCDQRTPLLAFDLTTGAQTWSFSGDKQLNLSPFAAGGTVYVGSDTGMMFGVDESTGAIAWSTDADALGAARPTVAGEGVLLTQLYGGGGVVAYAHVDQPDAGVVLGDGAAPTPFSLIPNANPIALAVDGTNVYWADFGAGQISEAPKSGGSPVVLWSSSTARPRALAVDATNVYFVASGSGQGTSSAIMAVPIAGGAASTLASSPALLTQPIVAGPSAVYWVDGAVQSVPKAGGAVTSVVPGVPAAALAVDASNLYWSASDGLHRRPLSGGPDTLLGVPANPEPTALGGQAATAIAVNGTNVYYGMNSFAGPGSVGYVPIDGGPATVLASGRRGSVVAIAVDDRNVYWVEGEGTIQQGAIAAVPKTGGRVAVLVSGLSDPMSVAVDGTGVYFPNVGGGIGKIIK